MKSLLLPEKLPTIKGWDHLMSHPFYFTANQTNWVLTLRLQEVVDLQ